MESTLTFPADSNIKDTADTLGNSDESASGNGLPEEISIYAGAAAGGVVLLVVIVIVVVCAVRKKNSKRTIKLQEKVIHTDTTSRHETLPNNQQYEMIPDNLLPPPSSGDLDLVAPYAEFGGVAHPGTESATVGATDTNYDFAVAVSGEYSEQGAGRDTSHVAGDVTRADVDAVQEAPPVSDVYATVNKPKTEETDMEDVVVDNVLYGEM